MSNCFSSFDPTVNKENGNSSPNLYSDDSQSFDSSKFNSQNQSPPSAHNISPDNENAKQIRRKKNRESAARSRQKIKDKLETLEKSVARLEDRKEALKNEKELILNEIEMMEAKMFELGVTKFACHKFEAQLSSPAKVSGNKI